MTDLRSIQQLVMTDMRSTRNGHDRPEKGVMSTCLREMLEMQVTGGGKVSGKGNGNYHRLDQSQTVSFTNAPSSINRCGEAGEHLLMLPTPFTARLI